MKYIKSFLSLLLFFCGLTAFAQERPQYAISLIPDSLKKNVNSVIREQSNVIVMKKPGKGKQSVKKVVSVFNDKAEDELVFHEFYDQFRKIDDIEINIYDEKGKYLKRSRKKDLQTQSVGDGMSLLTDTKVIFAPLSTDKYPVTIEIFYEINFEGLLEFSDFYPQTTDQSIISKTHSITTEGDNKVRYKNYRCNLSPKVKTEGTATTLTWEVKNVLPLENEPGSAEEDVPRVQISPTYFEMDDYPGNMSSWTSFGKWGLSLNEKINKIPEKNIPFYRDLVKNAKTDREKIAILYKHLQDNYRYVSIQLGIGGNKPFPAEFTEKKKYGDCKALSNFMYAMLDAVKIRSHYTIINAGYNSMPVTPDFPQDVFDHIILCVPLPKEKDTVWLECTSRTQPFGKLGKFTENRYGLLVTENGGVLAATPRSKAEDNILHTNCLINLDEKGSGTVMIDIKHSGEFTDISDFIMESDDQQKKYYLINRVGFKLPDEIQVSKKTNPGSSDYILHYDMSFEKIPEFSAGSKHFLNSRIYKFWNKALPKSENRKNDYYLEFPMIKTDSTIYQLPEGFIVDNLPKAASLKYALGNFQSSYSYDAAKRQVITFCRIELNDHIIPAARYQEATKFFSDVISEQQQKIVVKKE